MSRRLYVVLPLVALVLVAAAPAPEGGAQVTYRTVAKRADVVVRELAAQTGLQLKTVDDAKLHYLVMNVADVDSEALLTHIARVTSSRWQVDGDVRTLMPDEPKRRQEQAEKDAKRVEDFKKAQAKFKERLERKPEPSGDAELDAEAAMMMAQFEQPSEKALMELALLINPAEVGRLGDDGRIVFSTAPNRMQRAMPSGRASAILTKLVAEHNTWAEQRLKEEADQEKDMLADPEFAAYYSMFMDRMKPKLFEGPAAKALLVLEMEGTFWGFPSGAPMVELIVYDQKGVAVISQELQMGGGWMDEEALPEEPEEEEGKEVLTEEQQKQIKPEDRVLVEFSENTKRFMAMQNFEEASFALPEPVLELLRDPVTHDPLSFHHSDMAFAIAKAKKLDLVANLADTDMFDSFGMGSSEGGVSVGQAYAYLTEGDSADVVEKDGWLVIAPADPVRSRQLRQDRSVLKAFVQRVEREGTASLDAISNFALGSPSPMQNETSAIYLLAFAPQVFQGIMGDTMDWQMLRFYGSLLPPQKASLRSGGRVTYGQLTQQARGVLSNMAFGASANIKSAAKMKEESQQPSFLRAMGGFWGGMFGGGAKDYTEEPTEVMPGGLPGDGYLELALANEPILRPEGPKTMFMLAFSGLGADELAFFEIMKEASAARGSEETEVDMSEFFPVPERVKVGNRELLNFTFWLSREAGLTKTLTDDSVPKDARVVPFDQIPAELRLLIEQRKKAIRESPFGKMITMGIGQ